MQGFKNISELLTLKNAHAKDGRHLHPEDLSSIKDAALVFDHNEILWTGASRDIPSTYKNIKFQDLAHHVVMPGLVDSHTHLVFAGDRSFEYKMRLDGATYEEIYQAGGGILASTTNTNAASESKLIEIASMRIDYLIKKGVTTVEIKSGYGLGYQEELRLSQVIHQLKNIYQDKITIFNTYMAAHAVPKDFKSSGEYLKQIVAPLLEDLAKQKIIDAVDIFHEQNYFDDDDVKNLFYLAEKLNIPRKIHADELNDNNGALLAVDYQCLSADHLLMTNNKGIEALAKSSVVATLLPGTALFLGKKFPAARKMLDSGVKVSLASDFNPGSCHMNDLFLLAQMSAKKLELNSAELLCSITLNAAHSLGLKDRGTLQPGFKPIFSIIKAPSLDYILYNWNQTEFVLF